MKWWKKKVLRLLEQNMTTTQELLDAVNALAPKVDQLITLAEAGGGGIPAADQANIDAAGVALGDISAKIDAVLNPPTTTATAEAPAAPAEDLTVEQIRAGQQPST